MKIRLAISLFAASFCMVPSHAESNLLTKLSEKESWESMESRLKEAPARARSYFERKFNILFTTTFWILTVGAVLKCQQASMSPNQPYWGEEYVTAKEAYFRAVELLIMSGSASFCSTCWTLYRHHSLIRAAEEEIFCELLDDWETTKEWLPRELVPTFQVCMTLRRKDPENFNKGLPQLTKGLKDQIERHKNLERRKFK